MNTEIPQIYSLIFLVAIQFPVFMIARLARTYSPARNTQRIFNFIVIFYLIYFMVVGFFAIQGAFDTLMLPPKIILLTTLPLLTLLFGVVYNAAIYKETLARIPTHKLIQLHIFRLIGSFFIVLMLLGLLPSSIGLIAGLGDVITAVSSLWVASAYANGKIYARKLAIAWNTFGLLDIFATSATAIILTKISIDTGSQGVEVLASFPFCYIPAFAPATIIFLHVSIYRKLFEKK